MNSTMKSYSIRVEGGRTVLDSGEAAMPSPGAGQVLVRVHAAGLNRGEFIAAHGPDIGKRSTYDIDELLEGQ